MNTLQIEEFFKIFDRLNPHPQGELYYTTPFTLLVAVILSARATDLSVNKATVSLFKNIDTPEKMILFGEEKLKDAIKNIGLNRAKAQNIFKTSKILIERYEGQIPSRREELESLPGVGRKTANVILNVLFNEPTIAVDTHVFRVSNRTGLAPGATPQQVEEKLNKRVPQKYKSRAHFWLILHGRYICKARLPLCPECPVSHLCKFYIAIKKGKNKEPSSF